MFSTPKRHFLWAGAFFLSVKLAWVFLPTLAMGIPRLGDDALVYIWSAKSTVVSPQEDRSDIREIVSLRALDDAPSVDLDFARARVTMRATGTSVSPLAISLGALVEHGVETKWAFAFFEAFNALVLTVGLSYFLASFFGHNAASFALVALTFAVLPNQGIHYLIPSVFVLGLALILWTMVLKLDGQWAAKCTLSTLMLLVHTIGQVYVLVALALSAGKAIERRKFAVRDLSGALPLIAGVLAWSLISSASGAKAASTSGMGGLEPTLVLTNLTALFTHMAKLFWPQPLIGVLSVLGIWAIFRLQTRDWSLTWFTAVIATTLLSTTIVDLPGYPAELPSRVLVVMVLIGFGGCGLWLSETLQSSAARFRLFLPATVLITVTQFPAFYNYFYANLNSRYQIIDESKLKYQLLDLPDRTTILWGDADIQMMSALLLDTGRHQYIPISMVAGAPAFKERIEKLESFYITAPYPERINGLSTLGWQSLEHRYYGYGFNAYNRLQIQFQEKTIGDFYVRVTRNEVSALRVFSVQPKLNCSAQYFSDASDDTESVWLRITGCADATSIELESVNENHVLTGLSLNTPSEKQKWPWHVNGLKIRAVPKNPAVEATEVLFGWQRLFPKSLSLELEGMLKNIEYIDDSSGVIWFHAVPKVISN